MTNWRRAEWQYKANKWAVRVLCLLVLLEAPEVYWVLKYHFPWWDDVMEVVTVPLICACLFVKNKTDMYRWDQ